MLVRVFSIFVAFTTVTLGVLLLRAQNSHVLQSTAPSAQSSASPTPLILQENDGEHRLRRPQGPAGSESVPEFIIKIDKLNGNAEDFYVGYEILKPGGMIPFHKHHNSEEVVILEEGGATVTVGDKRSVTGPHANSFHSTGDLGVGCEYWERRHPSVWPVLASRI